MRVRALLLAAAIAAASLWPVAATPAACAGEAPRAALVVDTGKTVLNFCVSLPGDSVSGIDFIKLAAKQHGLTYKLGFGGAAVCHLAGVGPTGDDCFEQDPDFWGYWRGNGSGGWTWASTGAGSTTVTDGSVEGWAWGSGTGPETHPAPPVTRFADVCAPVESDGSKKGGRPIQKPAEPQGSKSAPAPAPGADPSAKPGDASKKKRPGAKGEKRSDKKRPKPAATPVPTPSPTPIASAEDLGPSELASDSERGGPPAAGIAALAGTALLLGGGVLLGRRRRARS
jgi:hypothetical protein